nr:DMT family transporter [Eubacterium sp. 1001713B170207_170306_E7]
MCAIVCEALFGLSYLFTKQATASASPLTLLSWRFITAFLVMNLCVAAGVVRVHLKGKGLWPLFLIAVFQPVIYFVGETAGIRLTTASESGAFLSIIPVVTLMAGALILKEKPTKLQVTGVCVTMAGVLACVLSKGMEASFNPMGYLMLLVAVVSYSLYAVFSQKAVSFSSAEKTYVMIAFGAFAFTAAALIQSFQTSAVMELLTAPFTNRGFLTAVLYQGIGCSILAFLLNNLAIATIGTNRSASFVGISTVVSILAGVVFLRESFSALQVLGTLFVIGGVYLANLKGNGY